MTAPENQTTGSELWSWVDELTPAETEDAPGDLWDEASPNDNIPF